MKKVLLSILLMGIVSFTFAQMKFSEGSWAEIKKKAKKEKKYIYLDAYASWCGPCKWMEKTVFSDAKVGEFFNKNFINYKVDMEKGEGPTLSEQFKVEAYPTLLFFNPKGELVHKVIGARDAEPFIDEAKRAMNPNNNLAVLRKKYAKGERSRKFLENYVDVLFGAGADEEATEVATSFINQLPKEDWLKDENWYFINFAVSNPESEIFQYLYKNREKLEANIGKDKAKSFLENAIMNKLNGTEGTAEDVENFKKWVKEVLPEEADRYSTYVDYLFHNYHKTEDSFKYAKAYFDAYCVDYNALNTAAWQYYEEENDKEKLKSALNWGLKSVSIDKNYFNLDTVAHLYFKLGDKENAKKYAEEAYKMGEENGEDTIYTFELLEKLK